MKRLQVLATLGLLALGAGALTVLDVSAHQDWTGCASCHGDFRASPYTSQADGQSWGASLHDVHVVQMLSNDCQTCHDTDPPGAPVFVGSSAGGTGLQPYGCSGCHGRSQDGTGSGTVGFGAGLRQHHWRAAVTSCSTCHTDSNPANKTPVNEKTKPPYYANPGTGHPLLPTDPCNPAPAYPEDFAASTLGLDNDGNDAYDNADGACSAAPTPGEASNPSAPANMMRVTAFNKSNGNVSISYVAACGATDNTVEYGALSNVKTYGYDTQVCAIGNSGTATFNLGSRSVFFLVVANNGTVEGSYGRKRSGGTFTERPEDTTVVTCPKPQDLSRRCD